MIDSFGPSFVGQKRKETEKKKKKKIKAGSFTRVLDAR